MATRYRASLDLGHGTGNAPVPVAGLVLREEFSAGWEGRAVLALSADTPLGIGEILGAVLARGVVPGCTVIVRLALADAEAPEGDAGRVVRTWPCVIARVDPEPPPPDASRAECVVELEDPIRHLFPVPVRAVFAGQSIGEMTGGALALAGGMDATPTLAPLLPATGSVSVVEDTRESLSSIPYAIACGENLGEWLERVHAPLGVRTELRGLADGGVEWTLSDRPPGGEPVETRLVSGDDEDGPNPDPGPPAVRVRAIRGRAGRPRLGAVLDDIEEPALWRFDSELPIGILIEGAGVGPDEGWRRATFEAERAWVDLLGIELESRHPDLRPGSLIGIRDFELAGIGRWQVVRVRHEVRGGTYANRLLVLRGDVAWRPRPPPPPAPRTVTAFVSGDPEMLPNEPVPRDRLGRIPIRIPCQVALADSGDESAPPRIDLPIVQPMAGALHGLAPGHRNGDACRVTVHHPFHAEIDGFVYREAQPVYGGSGLAPGWAGIIVEHDGAEAWSGWTFERGGEDAQ